jgi:hypothetical protein
VTTRGMLLLNSTVAFIVAGSLTILLHETSHAIAGIALGAQAIQSPFAVDYLPALTDHQQVLTALTGPIFSLVSGLVAMQFRLFRGFWTLVWGWFGVLSAEEGFGYFTIAGIVRVGDTGTAMKLLQAPHWTYWLCFVVGIAGLFLLAWRFSGFVVAVSRDVSDERAICVWPWIYGTLSLTALMAVYVLLTPGVSSAAVVAVMAGVVAIGVFAPMSMMFSKRPLATSALAVPVRPRAGLVLLAVLIVLNLALTRQLHWG